MKRFCSLVVVPLFLPLSGPLLAQSMGFRAIVPVVLNEPYIAERVRDFKSPNPDDSISSEKTQLTIMRDSAGRLREETQGSQPDPKKSYHLPWVQVLDPVSMQQIDIDVLHKTYLLTPIPQEVKSYRSRVSFCSGPLSFSSSNGSVTHLRYEELGRTMMQGVPADGCRITVSNVKGGFSYVTEVWKSSDLQINISSVTRYDNGREESDRVVRLQRIEPNAALFRLPNGYTDMTKPLN